ncbi:MAG TPA: efflux RND transporter periplasmic adaptor subunit [Acidobacteriota bacterium]|nr:efflux RND transporter periplasmic adaptor subunit [Acidobacteriota bacterium]
MAKNRFSISLRVFCALSLLLSLYGCKKEEAKEATSPVPVVVGDVQQGTIDRIIVADAVLYPVQQAAIIPKINAPVSRFLVNRGDRVSSGQLLAILENRDLAAAAAESKALYDQAEAAYHAATASSIPEESFKTGWDVQAAKQAMDAAQKVYEGRQKMLAEGAIARRSVDDAQVAYIQARSLYETTQKHLQDLQSGVEQSLVKNAASQRDAAKKHYETSTAQLSYSEIHSPIDGIVADRPFYIGEMATTDKPLITVVDISRIVARTNVTAEQIRYVKVGAKGRIAMPDGSNATDGKVTVVSPSADAGGTTLQVWVEAPNPGGKFKPGTGARVSITAETLRDVVTVPVEALLTSNEGKTVVKTIDKDMVAHEKKVETGVRNEGRVQILSGISVGEKVVTVGGVGLEDKARVVIATVSEEEEDEK